MYGKFGDEPNKIDLLPSTYCPSLSESPLLVLLRCSLSTVPSVHPKPSIATPTHFCGQPSVSAIPFIELKLIVNLHHGAVDDPHVRPDPLCCKSKKTGSRPTLMKSEPAVSKHGLTSIAAKPQKKHSSRLTRSEPSRKRN